MDIMFYRHAVAGQLSYLPRGVSSSFTRHAIDLAINGHLVIRAGESEAAGCATGRIVPLC